MKAPISILLVLLATTACSRKALPTREFQVEKRDSLVLIRDTLYANDSASVQAIVTCDSLGRVYLSEVQMLQGRLLDLQLQQQGSGISVKAKSSRQERIEQRNITRYREVYRYVETPLTTLQKLYMRVGKLVLLVMLPLMLTYIAYRAIR